MSRATAKDELTLDEFKKSMEGIYFSSINMSTLDESPFAYKPIDDMVESIVDIIKLS